MFLRYTYDPFGNVTSINAPMTVDIDDLNRYTYNGEDYDYNTGLQYLRARYYSTGTGSFISQDTYLGDLLNPLSQNRYTYVHNSPVMYDDPSGQSATANIGYSTRLAQKINDDIADVPCVNSAQASYSNKVPLGGSVRNDTKISTAVVQAKTFSAYAKVCGTLKLRTNGGLQQIKGARSRLTGEYITLRNNPGRIVHQESKLAGISEVLDYVGLIPVIGDLADGTNAVLYLAQGDYFNAAISAVAVLPFGDLIKIAVRGGDNLLRITLKHGDEAIGLASGIARIGDKVADAVSQIYKNLSSIVDKAGKIDYSKLNELKRAIQKGTFSVDELQDISRTMSNLGVTEAYENAMKKIDFGTYLKNMTGGSPADMVNPHAHHILFKTGIGESQQQLVGEAQEILRKYGIDPIIGLENLTWAPNKIVGQHDINALTQVVEALRNIDEMGGGYEEIVAVLGYFGKVASGKV